MTEFITRNYGNDAFEVIIKTDSKEHYKAAENFARQLIDHAKPVTDNNIGGNMIPYSERVKTYMNALIHFGDKVQMVVAIEELSECQKEICKILRGGENFPHLAEEIADATIMLEQLRMMFNINDLVCAYMDAKVRRLDEDLKGCGDGKK
ncbi:MAG: hypothetical protein J6V25_04095 [Oscillospiraceae bacterium]|nr:hypothetical protein [Oscillospiraceae bacterium]